MISAGRVSDIRWADDRWIFLDIGFSSRSPTCGLLFGNDLPQCVRFGEAKQRILERIQSSSTGVELVIEAPLSICFDSKGNPKGRKIEREGNKHRYWYENLGCAVMIAAMYLVRGIHDANVGCTVRLFEGFVSFKDRSSPSDHVNDVRWLRDVVRDPQKFCGSILTSDQLKSDPADVLASAFCVAGIDCGVPVVIKRSV